MSEDIDKLFNIIKEGHKEFLDSAGKIPYRVSADYHLLLVTVSSKISLIASLLKESGVIDNYKFDNYGESIKVTVSKKGLDFKVEILTNGTIILMRSANNVLDDDGAFMSRQFHRPNRDSGWDWPEFTKQLLSFIHFTMYKSQKVEEINLSLLINGEK